MVELDRIYDLAKKQGIKKQFLCSQIGINEAYFRQAKAKGSLPENVVIKAADILGTTTDYLHGKTDIKEKAVPDSEDSLSDKEKELLSAFRSLTSEEQDLFLALFRAKKK